MLPNFICIGAQKSGTTTLFDLLKLHPDIYLPSCKETHFFDKNDRYLRGFQWYESEFFSEVRGERAIGEITPIYMYLDYVPKRICNSLGVEIKLIFILRNPIDRAYSHYWMNYKKGYEKECFDSAINLEKERIQNGEFEKDKFSYIDRGFYSDQIKRYLRYFPKENMCFVIFEKFVKDIKETMKRIFTFLEVEPHSEIKYNVKSNPASASRFSFLRNVVYGYSGFKKIMRLLVPSKKIRRSIVKIIGNINIKSLEKPEIRKDTSTRLIEIYKREVKELENLIGEDLSLWFNNASQD